MRLSMLDDEIQMHADQTCQRGRQYPACREPIRRFGPAHQRVPIVVITTQGAEADRKRALALGASAYLVKPVQADRVVETVRRLLVPTA